MCASPQICKFLWLIYKLRIHKFIENSAQFCLETVQKVVFKLFLNKFELVFADLRKF